MGSNIVVIAGVPGAGKTSVLNAVHEKLAPRFEIISFGDEMLNLCMTKELVDNRDDMRKLSLYTQRKLQIEVSKIISDKQGNILLDTHCAIKTPVGYIIGLTEPMIEVLKPVAVVLIDAHEVEIQGRRKLDSERPGRASEESDDIHEHKIINRVFASIIASKADALLRIIQNKTGEFDRGVQKVIDTLEFVLSKQ